MFFDTVEVTARSGRGGHGAVSFRREKYINFGGPDGGHGGRGGHVFLRVNPHLNTLVSLANLHHVVAENGHDGGGNRMTGARGQDLYVDVPAGTIVTESATGEVLGDLKEAGDVLLVARGGRGGRGNDFFKTPTRQTPKFAENGGPAQEITIKLELKLIADVGLLGKPNAGKSTLLATVSRAKPKIAAYPFTTLSPNLGVVQVDGREFVMADIPGLIEGASQGVGLGIQFLRHVERTRLLVHLLDGSGLDPAEDMRAINNELAQYSETLAAKPQIVVITKLDLPDSQVMIELMREELREVDTLYGISAVSHEGVTELMRVIADRLDAMPPEEEDDLFVHHPTEERESRQFSVTRLDGETFQVRGEQIERQAAMTDWNNIEAAERFERIMIARGVAERLEEAGVSLGDTVVIGDIELEWR